MTENRQYQRFTLSDRIEHWTQMAAFATLAITGLIQKFAEARISQTMVGLLGGIETTRIIHRSATVILMLGVIYRHRRIHTFRAEIQAKNAAVVERCHERLGDLPF